MALRPFDAQRAEVQETARQDMQAQCMVDVSTVSLDSSLATYHSSLTQVLNGFAGLFKTSALHKEPQWI